VVNIFDRRVGGGNGTQPPLTSLCFRGFGAARVNSSMHPSLSCFSPSKKNTITAWLAVSGEASAVLNNRRFTLMGVSAAAAGSGETLRELYSCRDKQDPPASNGNGNLARIRPNLPQTALIEFARCRRRRKRFAATDFFSFKLAVRPRRRRWRPPSSASPPADRCPAGSLVGHLGSEGGRNGRTDGWLVACPPNRRGASLGFTAGATRAVPKQCRHAYGEGADNAPPLP
jgi:hypothetical protein